MSGLTDLVASLPRCAATCMLIAVEASTCATTDSACACHDEDLNTQATTCITANCTVRESLTTKNLTSTSCGIAPYVDHSYVRILAVFVSLSAVSVLLRVAARLQARVPVWWDDIIITLSFLGCVAYASIFWALKPHGLGTDIWAVPFDDITLSFQAFYALFILYVLSRDLVRLSILLFYHRIFGRTPLARRLIQFTFVLIIACYIAFVFAIAFGCTPIDYFWTAWDGEHEGHCINTNAIFWAGAFIVIPIDIWIMLISLPFIVRLKLSMQKRVLTGIMFTFGIFVTVVSLYRLRTINRFTLSQNPTADFVEVGIWSGLELYVGIICACLPNFHHLLKPLYRYLRFSRAKSPHPSALDSSGSSRPHKHLNDVGGTPKPMIRATTTVDVEHHVPESQDHLYDVDRGDVTGGVEEVELGTRKRGETRGSVWC